MRMCFSTYIATSIKGIINVVLRGTGMHSEPENSVPALCHESVPRNSRSPVVQEAQDDFIQNKMCCALAQAQSSARSLRCKLRIFN